MAALGGGCGGDRGWSPGHGWARWRVWRSGVVTGAWLGGCRALAAIVGGHPGRLRPLGRASRRPAVVTWHRYTESGAVVAIGGGRSASFHRGSGEGGRFAACEEPSEGRSDQG